jgi:predicted SAM-dependent methyltransferase
MTDPIETLGVRKARELLTHELKIARLHRDALEKARHYAGRTGLKLHLGCADNIKPGWVNIDLSADADLCLDLREAFPFAEGSCTIIYSEHFFEHVDYPAGAATLLGECLRVLAPSGIFSVGVPDTEWPLLEYARVRQEGYFATAKRIFHPAWCETDMDHINYHFRQDGEHLYAYDEITLCHVLTRAGFERAHRRAFDPELDLRERELGTLYVDAYKPA